MKNGGLLGKCWLKGTEGDAMNVLLVACGHNLRKILHKLKLFWLHWKTAFAKFLTTIHLQTTLPVKI